MPSFSENYPAKTSDCVDNNYYSSNLLLSKSNCLAALDGFENYAISQRRTVLHKGAVLFLDFRKINLKIFSEPENLSDCKRYDFYLNRVPLSDKQCEEYVEKHTKEMCK